MRLSLGGDVVLDRSPATGAFASPLYTDDAVWVEMDVVWPHVALGLLSGNSLGTPTRGPGETPAPPDSDSTQFALRIRLQTPGDRFFVAGLAEFGVRSFAYREHIVETCEFERGSNPWCRDTDLWEETEHGHGGTTSDFDGYLATAALPVVRIGERSFLYGGIGWDNFVTGWEMADWGHPGAEFQERYVQQDVFPAYLGLDLGLTDMLSGLLTVQFPFGDEGAAVPTADVGLSIDF